MEWITTVNGLITLLTGLVGLIGTGVGAFFAIKNWFKLLKTKKAKEIWALIQKAADAAMREFEHSTLKGTAKKDAVVNAVKVSCKAAGIENLGAFIDQLDSYIEDSINWFNGMQNKN